MIILASNPAVTSSNTIPKAFSNLSKVFTGPNFTVSNKRNNTNAASKYGHVCGKNAMAVIYPAISSITIFGLSCPVYPLNCTFLQTHTASIQNSSIATKYKIWSIGNKITKSTPHKVPKKPAPVFFLNLVSLAKNHFLQGNIEKRNHLLFFQNYILNQLNF